MTQIRVPLAAVIGWPISHSKSPLIHGHWLAQHGIKGHYIPVGIAPENFEETLQSMPDLGFVGANVTIPYKERALALATKTTPRAQAIGAANTLTFLPDGGLLADNTDGIGFLNNLKQNAPHWQANAGTALVLGAGGAARAILWALLEDGAPQILLTNRTQARSEALAAELGAKVKTIPWADIPAALPKAKTIVNTTALGMTGQPPLEIDLSTADTSAMVTDIVYNPLETKLISDAKALNLATVDGLGMLLHQAVPGFAQWFGTTPQVTDELRQIILSSP